MDERPADGPTRPGEQIADLPEVRGGVPEPPAAPPGVFGVSVVELVLTSYGILLVGCLAVLLYVRYWPP